MGGVYYKYGNCMVSQGASDYRETQRQAQWQVFIEQEECCEKATKRAALQHYKLVRL